MLVKVGSMNHPSKVVESLMPLQVIEVPFIDPIDMEVYRSSKVQTDDNRSRTDGSRR